MNPTSASAAELFALRNQFGAPFTQQKINLLNQLSRQLPARGSDIILYHEALLFMLAYPESKELYTLTAQALTALENRAQQHLPTQNKLFNTGITGSHICGSFGFQLVQWLRQNYSREEIVMDAILAEDSQICYILSAVMPQVESEIMQDANATWQQWLQQVGTPEDDVLDKFIAIFSYSDIRPEVKDELWTALGINLMVKLNRHTALPASLRGPLYYHKQIIKKDSLAAHENEKPEKVKLSETDAQAIIDCARMVLIRHIREIDPVSFSAPEGISYYRLKRGVSVALFAMTDNRRHPVDSYMGYVAFKNGLPVAYAGSWLLFDSGRIGLSMFPAYRGGESLYMFEQILNLHRQVYKLKRFSVDPYQIGKENSDGIKSGAFWLYYKLGFRPIQPWQKQLAEAEAQKIHTQKGYRSPASVLNRLADSKLQLLLGQGAVNFDAADLSLVYAALVKKYFGGDRRLAETKAFDWLIKLLKLEKYRYHYHFNYVLRNWCVFLIPAQQQVKNNKALQQELKKILLLKATARETDYVFALQQATQLKKLMMQVAGEYGAR
ncbi:MAG: hypothetical protein U0T74_14440 [Chitinophagales bacterium]